MKTTLIILPILCSIGNIVHTSKKLVVFLPNTVLGRTRSTTSKSNKSWWRGRQAEYLANDTDSTSNGARHPNGTLGMIVDPSPQRLHLPLVNPVNNSLFCPLSNGENSSSPQAGFEGLEANIVLQKIHMGVVNSQSYLQNQVTDDEKENYRQGTDFPLVEENNTAQTQRKSRILCFVYTSYTPVDNHSNLRSQAETWGRQCDGFIAASNFTDHSIGAIDLVHNGLEEYANMWQKTRSILAYAYHNYLEEFDFFHLCGDDVYIVMDNLRAYLDGPEVLRLEGGYIDKISGGFSNDGRVKEWASARPRPLIFGCPMAHKRMPVLAGGPGYTLNRAALSIFNKQCLDQFFPNARDSREDVFVGSALAGEGIFVSDTKDDKNGGRYGGAATFIYNFKGVSPIGVKWLTRRFGLHYNMGIDSISKQFVAHHLKYSKMELIKKNRTIPELMHRYHVILNGLCKN